MKTPDPFQYIRDYYGVPAKKEQRIAYSPGLGMREREGRIVGASGQYIRLHFDGELKPASGVYHPTSGIRYIESKPEASP